ncbi:uncharacterized protein FIBRA_02096 [Fibroporia radiculosa]|uniref:Mannosyltransferase n=1 Tax=Fibroporia radiculosa TaxID=599839 RepID=J4H1N2_9APHY|nr:uncharacterized protein FIBRA_02096 [Fibroporia radiculosa]CCM00069.1 predicted protein [Fibroporia radiculosa]
MTTALDALLVGTSWCHVLLAPYTKVEESFNLHATHDVLMYGIQPAALHNYDHFVFPGAVPRTFVGSVLLAWLSSPAIHVAQSLGLVSDKFDLQIIVRLVLATLNAFAFCLLRRAVSRRFGGPTGVLFALLTCTQFHLPFWVGRTLPNMFALFPVNLAHYLLINRAPNSLYPPRHSLHAALALLVFTATVFRSEVLLLLGPMALHALIWGHTSITKLVMVGLVSVLASAGLTIGVDSYFWQQWPLWPELHGLYFNVIEGKSSEWGVLPYHTYFTSFLPKLLLASLPLSMIGFATDSRIRGHLGPALMFVGLISALGHKEWRFIIYVVPIFNIAAARGASRLVSRRKRTVLGRFCFLAVAGLLASNCIMTYLFTMASMANYPGGEALSKFNEFYSKRDNVHVHISNLAAQTGASLFLHTHAPPFLPELASPTKHWTYNKTENLSPRVLKGTREVTHIVAESTSASSFTKSKRWDQVDTIDSFDRWVVNPAIRSIPRIGLGGNPTALLQPLKMAKSDKLVILERNTT